MINLLIDVVFPPAVRQLNRPIFTIFVTKWKIFAWLLSIWASFPDSSRDVVMATILGKTDEMTFFQHLAFSIFIDDFTGE